MVKEFNDIELMGVSSNPTLVRQKLNEIVNAVNATNSMRDKALSGDLVFKCTPATHDEALANQNRGAGIKQKETLTPVLVRDSVVTAGTANHSWLHCGK